MPTLATIIAAVVTTIQDPDVTEDEIKVLINEGYDDVSGRVLLPLLETSTEVTAVSTDTEVAAPDGMDLDRNIFSCASGDSKPDIKVLSSSGLMIQRYPSIGIDNEEGDVLHVCLSGGKIMYHPVPTDDTVILVRHHKLVTALNLNTDIPSAIPIKHQKKLLHSYACKELYNDIEDGIEGAMPNVVKFENRYEKALAELELEVQQGQSRPTPDRSGGGWI